MKPLFDKSGGYRKLHSFTFATMIHLGTIRFCKRFIARQDDPLGKTAGQMIGAARSGRQNIIEASERSATSKETEIRLTDVARASLAELLGDYEIFLAEKNVVPWSLQDEDRRQLCELRLPSFSFTDDSLHDYWSYFHEARKPFSAWLDNNDEKVAANAMIVLIRQTMVMLDRQLQSQAKSFINAGGFNERMAQCRKVAGSESVPDCPECGKPMCQRFSRSSESPGKPFWGCSSYPKCKRTREIQEKMTQ